MDEKSSAQNTSPENESKQQRSETAKAHPVEMITTIDLRQKMGDILNRVFYGVSTFRIQRKQRTLAYLVSPEYIERVGELIAYLQDNDPMLAKKLGIRPRDDLRDFVTKSDDPA